MITRSIQIPNIQANMYIVHITFKRYYQNTITVAKKNHQKNEFVAYHELAVSQHFDNQEKKIMLQQSGRQCQKMDANNLIWTNQDLEA